MKNQLSLRQLPSKQERHELFGSVKPGPKTKPVDKDKMPDLQNMKKDFLFDIDVVGVANVKHPIIVHSQLQPQTQTTIATFRLSSSVKRDHKGTNMSRFTEQLHDYHKKGLHADFASLKQFAKELAERLEQSDATIEISFPWFFERTATQSQLTGLNHANAKINIHYDQNHDFNISVGLEVLTTTLCPCSKEISEYSAHNQRGKISMEVTLTQDFDDQEIDWKAQLLEAAESNASARIYPVLKRPDEKAVTEQAYENPRFVEDMVRLVAADLYEMPFVQEFRVTCQNEESIHLHDAIASIHVDKLKNE